MNYQTRADWGAQPPKWNPGVVTNSQGVFIHYNGPAVSNNVLAGDYQAVRTFLQGIQRFHQNTQGWPDIAYSWCVDSMGTIWELRGWDRAQAATLNWNWSSHSIFLPLGGNQAPTDAQIAGCQTVIAEHNRKYGNGFVRGHQDAPNSTSCPGPVVLPMVRAGKFTPAATPTPTRPNLPTAIPQPPVNKPTIPTPPGVNLKMNEPVMLHIEDKIWMFYRGTPWRCHIKTPADVQTYQFFGVKLEKLDKKSGEFFIRYSQEVKTG